ncbi:MAG: hypothetical protein JXB38_08175 [Anaerolineales bacterium]|nr:hypothetical protein [Anaerolineales bacterium]
MKRPLSVMDNFMWFASKKRMMPFVICMRVRGKFTPDQFFTGLEKLKTKYPWIISRVVEEEKQTYFVQENVPDIPVRVLDRQSDDHWRSLAKAEMSCPFPPETGPFIRFHIFKGEEVSEIMTTTHHVLGDGMAIIFLMRDFIDFIAHPKQETQPLPPLPTFTELVPLETVQRLQDYIPDSARATMEAGPTDMVAAELTAFNQDITQESPLHILSWEMTTAETASFVERARKEKVSVGAAICTAFLIAFSKTKQAEDARLSAGFPVDMRKRYIEPANEFFSNHLTYAQVFLDNAPGTNFWETAREIHSQLIEETADDKVFGLVIFLEKMIAMLPPSMMFNQPMPQQAGHNLVITNLGRLEIPQRHGNLQLEAIYGPVVNGYEEEIGLGVNTFNDVLRFVFAFREKRLPLNTGEQIKSTVMKLIRSVI